MHFTEFFSHFHRQGRKEAYTLGKRAILADTKEKGGINVVTWLKIWARRLRKKPFLPPLPSSHFENISPKFLTFPACFFAPLSNFYFLRCRRRYLGDPKTAAGWVFILKTLHRLVSFLHVHNIYLHSPQLPARSLCAYVKQLRSDASTLRRGKQCVCVAPPFSSFFLLRFAFLRGQGCILLQQRRSKKKKNLFPSFSPGRALSV